MDFFLILPSEIIIGILSRLNVGDILRCKRVCKSWLHLVGTDYFISSHLSRSVPGQFVRVIEPAYLEILKFKEGMKFKEGNENEDPIKDCEILEFKEGNENQVSMIDPKTGHINRHCLIFNSVMRFNIPLCEDTKLDVHSSANGLLFLVKTEWMSYDYEFFKTNYICNPITREYINICDSLSCHPAEFVGYGFGVSKLGKYTVLRVRQRIRGGKCIHCDVYTLGSGSWRSVAPPDPSLCCDANIPLEFVKYMDDGPCLDGRFHWLHLRWKTPHILCFDLETELFSLHDLPLPFEVGRNRKATLSALGNSLCLCDLTSGDGMIIWLAEERVGVEKSWIKGFVIPNKPNLTPDSSYLLFNTPLSVVKAFKNGDYLMKYKNSFFLYQPRNSTVDELDRGKQVQRIRYSPSFLSLSSFNMENVISF